MVRAKDIQLLEPKKWMEYYSGFRDVKNGICYKTKGMQENRFKQPFMYKGEKWWLDMGSDSPIEMTPKQSMQYILKELND